MARYTGPKTKLSKRVGKNLFLKGARSFSAKDDYAKKPYKSGQHGKKFKQIGSNYSRQLTEKQALKFSYGLMEKQLTLLFKKAFRQKGDTGVNALIMLERRLDNVVYKSGLANSRAQARQLVSHAQFYINGKNCNIPSFLVEAADVITVKPNKLLRPFWTAYQLQVPVSIPSWIESDKKSKIKVLNLPIQEDLPQEFKISDIVEWYSTRISS